jgi:hypothetical protein
MLCIFYGNCWEYNKQRTVSEVGPTVTLTLLPTVHN